MERRINLRLAESDAKLLMQMCCMLSDKTIRDIYEEVRRSYDVYDMPQSFERYYGDFVPTSMGALASDICEKLEGIFCPEEDVMVDLTKEVN